MTALSLWLSSSRLLQTEAAEEEGSRAGEEDCDQTTIFNMKRAAFKVHPPTNRSQDKQTSSIVSLLPAREDYY